MIYTLFLSLFLLSAFTVTVTARVTPPVPIRECYPKSPDYIVPLVPSFATLLEAESTHDFAPFPDGYLGTRFQRTINGTCLELLTMNTDVLFPLSVDGAGLAHTARGIATQCSGLGWGYYTDRETGNTFHYELWAILQECTNWYPKTSGSRVICPADTTGNERHDPKLPCPGQE